MANEIEAYTNFLFYNSEDGKTSIQVIADADAETISILETTADTRISPHNPNL